MGRDMLGVVSTSSRHDAEPTVNQSGQQSTSWRTDFSSGGGWLLFLLVLWLIIAGRWGSYIGFPNHQLYVTELVLIYVLCLAVVSWRDAPARLLRLPLWLVAPLAALLAWSLVRTLPALSHGSEALRDLAPYAYAVAAALALVLNRPASVKYTVLAGTVFHAAWVTPPLFGDAAVFAGTSQLGRTRVFELRTDFDAAVAGVLACACLLIAMSLHQIVQRFLFGAAAVWSGTLVVLINNRSGLLATAAAVAWTAVYAFRRSRHRRPITGGRGLLVAVGSAVIGGLLVVGVLAFTPAGQRMTQTFDQEGGGIGNGTANARLAVYEGVLNYVTESPERVIAGVGMGPDFLTDAGVVVHFDPGQTLGVRSPHNFLLGTLARLGIIGALLQLAVVIGGYVLARGVLVRTSAADDVTRLAALLVVALPVAAAVGVVLESPFGAVPYYWGYGVLLVEEMVRRRDESMPPVSRDRSLAAVNG